MLGEEVACAAVSLHLCILSYMQVLRYSPRRQLHSVFGDFSDGVYYVMKHTPSIAFRYLPPNSARLVTNIKQKEAQSARAESTHKGVN